MPSIYFPSGTDCAIQINGRQRFNIFAWFKFVKILTVLEVLSKCPFRRATKTFRAINCPKPIHHQILSHMQIKSDNSQSTSTHSTLLKFLKNPTTEPTMSAELEIAKLNLIANLLKLYLSLNQLENSWAIGQLNYLNYTAQDHLNLL